MEMGREGIEGIESRESKESKEGLVDRDGQNCVDG